MVRLSPPMCRLVVISWRQLKSAWRSSLHGNCWSAKQIEKSGFPQKLQSSEGKEKMWRITIHYVEVLFVYSRAFSCERMIKWKIASRCLLHPALNCVLFEKPHILGKEVGQSVETSVHWEMLGADLPTSAAERHYKNWTFHVERQCPTSFLLNASQGNFTLYVTRMEIDFYWVIRHIITLARDSLTRDVDGKTWSLNTTPTSWMKEIQVEKPINHFSLQLH